MVVMADFPGLGSCEAMSKPHTVCFRILQRPADNPCHTTVDLQGGAVAVHAAARMPVEPRPLLARPLGSRSLGPHTQQKRLLVRFSLPPIQPSQSEQSRANNPRCSDISTAVSTRQNTATTPGATSVVLLCDNAQGEEASSLDMQTMRWNYHLSY
jgi:hypothetical protein